MGWREERFFLSALCLAALLLQNGVLKTKQSINNSSDMHICVVEDEVWKKEKRRSKLMRWVLEWRDGAVNCLLEMQECR